MVSQSQSDNSSVPDVMAGMQPAFQNRRTGESHLAQDESGNPIAGYSFHGLPDDWVIERDTCGIPCLLHPDIIAGYWRNASFIALSQLANLPLDG